MDLRYVSQRVKVILDYAQEVQAHEVGFQRVTGIKSNANHPNHANKHLNMHEYIAEMAEAVLFSQGPDHRYLFGRERTYRP